MGFLNCCRLGVRGEVELLPGTFGDGNMLKTLTKLKSYGHARRRANGIRVSSDLGWFSGQTNRRSQ